MKLEDLRKKAKSGEANPDDLGTCELDGCDAKATDRDPDGSWCWAHRERSFRDALNRPVSFTTVASFEPEK